MIDREGNIINWNKNFLHKGDYTEDILENNAHCENYFHFSEGEAEIGNIIDAILEDGEINIECSLKTSKGDSIPILMNGFRIDYANEKEAVAIAIDQSKQKEAEKQLADEKMRFQLATHAASDVIWDRKFNEDNIWWSEGLKSKFGYEKDRLNRGVDWWKSKVHPDDVEDVVDALDEFFESEGNYWSDNYRFQKADGSYAYVRDTIYLVRDEQQNPQRLVGAIVDETERIKAEKKLRSAHDRLSHAQEIAKLGYFEWIPNKDILQWSDRILQIYGVADQSESFELADYQELVHPDDRVKVQKMIEKITRGEEVRNIEHRIITPAGQTKYIEQRITIDTNEGGEVELIRGTAQDITDQVKQRKQLERFSKVAMETSNLVVITDAEGKTEWVNESF